MYYPDYNVRCFSTEFLLFLHAPDVTLILSNDNVLVPPDCFTDLLLNNNKNLLFTYNGCSIIEGIFLYFTIVKCDKD